MILNCWGFITYTIMDVSLLVTLIETTIPFGVTFNQWGVSQKGFRYTFKFRKLVVTFDVCAINGLWGGEVDILTNTWGSCGPIARGDFKFCSFEECISYLWKRADEMISRNKEGITMEYLHFKVAMNKWLVSSSEEKFNVFKEVDFYGS